ncbi:hypothetical protein [Streptomyces sp. CB01881]|uniref:hypothetical protein n=1 Tax=Streptomyces sp. CB01881 TaxID=2078691 RepID=UPI0011DFC1AF|nr:hypothetical protein [Streptomyces sp. CB01881]TYC73809.1 hypothetical protein EH183_17440 [Streptomyces sp. CB01881]
MARSPFDHNQGDTVKYSEAHTEPDDDPAPAVADPATGEVRVLADLCGTCIYRPGNLMHLAPGRLRQLAQEALARRGHIVCHSTLPALAPPGTKGAICRGFANAHGSAIFALRMAPLIGRLVEVPPPPTHDSTPEERNA